MSDERLFELVLYARRWTGRPFTTAPELAEQVGMTRQAVHERLQALVADGQIQKYKAGQAAIYWVETDDDGAESDGDESA